MKFARTAAAGGGVFCCGLLRFFFLCGCLIVPARATFTSAISSKDLSYSNIITVQAPKFANFGPKSWTYNNFTGALLLHNVSDSEKKGVAILLPWASGFSFENLVRKEYNLGVAAVVTTHRFSAIIPPGWNSFYVDGSNVRDIAIPIVEIPRLAFLEIFNNLSMGATANVTLTCCDANEWEDWNSSGWMIGFSVVTGGFSALVFSLAFLKLTILMRQFFGQRKAKFNIGMLVLLVICIGNIFRAIYTGIDPIASRRVIPNPWLYVLWSFSFPFTLIASLAVTFYWLELITQTKSVVVSSFLNRLLWPFIAASCVILGVEFATSSIRGLNYSVPTMVVVTGLAYVAILLTLSLLFIITGSKVLKQLAFGNSSQASSKSTRLRGATIKLMVSTVGLVGGLICAFLIGLTDVASQLVTGHIMWLYLFLSMTFSDFMLVLAVRASLKNQPSQKSDTPPENKAPTPVGPNRTPQNSKSSGSGGSRSAERDSL